VEQQHAYLLLAADARVHDVLLLGEDLVELLETFNELVRKFELTPDAVVGVVHVLGVAVVDAHALAGVPRVPLEQLALQVLLVAHHPDPFVELVELLAFALTQGRVQFDHPVLDGDHVRGVGLQETAFLVLEVLLKVGLTLDELLDHDLHLLGEGCFNLLVDSLHLGVEVLDFILVDFLELFPDFFDDVLNDTFVVFLT